MAALLRTPLYGRHLGLGATLVDFGGWNMPVQYPGGIVQEHLATARAPASSTSPTWAGFGCAAATRLAFFQHALTNNAAALEVGEAQYTMIPNETGGALDDAYLYRFFPDEYLLVVNASNRARIGTTCSRCGNALAALVIDDLTVAMAMVSLQGPTARDISAIVGEHLLPEPARNRLGTRRLDGARLLLARTGYTGEPIGFELFIDSHRPPHSGTG